MPFAEHRAPQYPGEDIFDLPKSDDPRVKPWLEGLMQLGVLAADGKFLKPKGRLMRGISRIRETGQDCYLFRIEWEEPEEGTGG